MSASLVTYTAASSDDSWEQLRPAITHAWLNRASDLKHLKSILRQEYSIISTEKTCRTHLKRWGLLTYKRRQDGAFAKSLVHPPRARKGIAFRGERCIDQISRTSSPMTKNPVLPTAFRLQEFVLHSIDVFVSHSFPEPLATTTQLKARDLIHPKYNKDYSLSWQSVADLYQAAEGYFRGECYKKFVNTIRKAHLELKFLIGLPDSQSKDFQQTCQHTMITRFWRICHRLFKLDFLWPQYRYSFLLDFLIEVERLVSWFHGTSHPFARLLRAMGRLDKEYLQAVLKMGASRTIGVMAPMMDQRQRRMVFYAWTDFTHKT
ncbi:uncharacterized protein BKA55DRAFT_691789 [Fusarium redolens]|uniref:Clr5 domain-containing protein n=1 Tax=Fusarium redolens TaxID=48865 RepID=A0A9P9K4G3_FUSRE|nr:uncharacterized protein BKA55DRAFT_691789 [Fusarium redolens]KAH7247663.1 hypothetical protein BKA55DRAFT_691789 [Fusarium redolens]